MIETSNIQKFMIEAGIILDMTTRRGNTPLIFAIERGNEPGNERGNNDIINLIFYY